MRWVNRCIHCRYYTNLIKGCNTRSNYGLAQPVCVTRPVLSFSSM